MCANMGFIQGASKEQEALHRGRCITPFKLSEEGYVT